MLARTKLRIACGLLAMRMLPLLVDFAYWRDPAPAHPAVWSIAAVTALIAWWAARGRRAGWVVALIRALLQTLFMGLLVSNTLSQSAHMTEQLAQGLASLFC